MKQPILLILLVALCGLASCTSRSSSASLFTGMDSLLENYPDSALILLQDIDATNLSNSQQAEYALLMVQAMDKNYIPYTNDSLIMVAVDYYEGRPHKKDQQSWSYYYLGRVYEGLGDDIAATEAYLRALNIIGEKGVSKLHLYANINLGSCYYYQDLYERSMERYRKAYDIGIEIGNTSDLFYPLRAMGNVYTSLNLPDSALFYYHESLDLAEQVGDSLFAATVLSDIAQFYNMREMYNEANEYISRAIDRSPNFDHVYYYLKGDILSKLNRFDSAQYYLDKSLDMNNLYTYVASNYALYNLEKNIGNYKNAVQYADNYIVYYDSIQHQNQREEITKLMNDHALESHKKEVDARQQRFMLYYIIGFLVILSICVYAFFHIDRNKKKKLIGLQQDLMQNRSKLAQLQNKLASSTTEIEMERQENEAAQQQLQLRQKELCMRLFETSSSYKIVQEFVSAKRQKKYPKDLSEKDRLKVQQLISEIYIDFIQSQQQSFPQLSQGDVYCCVLAYMGFSNSLIGYLMGVDPNVVTQRRYRIKGKMDESTFNLIFSSSSTLK
ncbi:tetratricopeptide repeat protein [Bacteroides sp. 51]|uniref:tetratricopeptide repeat protein n=1 Tax=Bacteroides sp. 51 TaxID=2302938 RepID=UPI0013D5A1AB|nr:tetratricopeptide repeat protein [Bacteroides sp. 51]NDV80547.1 tetratricopeptide repeat protein [Bacteroides sp. 51]